MSNFENRLKQIPDIILPGKKNNYNSLKKYENGKLMAEVYIDSIDHKLMKDLTTRQTNNAFTSDENRISKHIGIDVISALFGEPGYVKFIVPKDLNYSRIMANETNFSYAMAYVLSADDTIGTNTSFANHSNYPVSFEFMNPKRSLHRTNIDTFPNYDILSSMPSSNHQLKLAFVALMACLNQIILSE